MHDHATQPTIAQRAFFALLYLSEGAPIGYIWWAMPTRLRAAGMPVEQVAALTSLLTLPWALKFLWAPAVDRLRNRRWGYRAWITLAQALMGLTLLPLALLPLSEITGIVTLLLISHAVAAATQDVSIDALAIATIPDDAYGRVTGWMQAGMLVGRATFGGLALTAEQWIGSQAVVLILIGCIWCTLAVVWHFPLDHIKANARPDSDRTFAESLIAVLSRRATWIGLAIALLAGAGFEAVGGLMGPFLHDRGLDKETVGLFFAFPVVLCMIVGSLIGGWAADRWGHKALVQSSILAIALAIAVLVAADLNTSGIALMAAAAPIYLALGSLTASSYALFMDLTDPAIGGTQFSAFMGATNLCEVWSIALAGAIVSKSDYPIAFGCAAAISLIALPLVPFARRAHTLPK